MNYYAARQLIDKEGNPSGKWHYTVKNDGVVWATGYCTEGGCSHASAEEARGHFKSYLLDKASFDGRIEQNGGVILFPCEVCGKQTDRVAEVPAFYVYHTLCDEHCNRDGLCLVLEVGEFAMS